MAVTQSPSQLMTASNFCLDLQTGVAATALCLREKLQNRCDAPQRPTARSLVSLHCDFKQITLYPSYMSIESVKHLHGNGPI